MNRPALPPVAPPLRAPDVAILIAFAAFVAWLGVRLTPVLVDDSFIYLRIAANIGHGEGWLYNTGDVGNAATSTLYTLLLSAIGAVVGYGAHALAVTYAITLFALLALQYLAWRASFGPALAAMIALGSGVSVHMLDSFGMETALLMALVTATALVWRARGDSWPTGVLAGLTALTRPEGLALLGLIGLVELIRRHRIAWRSVLAAGLVLVPWLAFAQWHFGSISSHTAAVKAAQRHLGWWASQPDFLVGFVQQAQWPWLTLPLALAGLVLAARRMWRGDGFAFLCIGFGALQVLGYQLLGAPAGYQWYYVPGNFALDLALLLLAATAIRAAARHISIAPRAQAFTLIAALATLGAMTRLAAAPWQFPAVHGFSAQYRTVGAWLQAHATPQDSFAATEIGYLGWYSGLRVLDIHGLLHARALPYLRTGNLHWWWDSGERPRYVVVHDPAWHGEPDSEQTWPAALSAQFHAQYREVFSDGGMHVYERAPTAAP